MLRCAVAILLGLAATASALPIGQPVGRYAAKGFPGQVPTSDTAAAPPVSFIYVTYFQGLGSASPRSGAGAIMVPADPALAPGDYHSLGEIGLSSSDGRQIVEIGWTVDKGLNGDLQPRLFVFHWVDGVQSCYNACGFVQVSTTKMPGMRVRVGVPAEYAIKKRGTDWVMYYQGEELGYFPGSLWPSGYTTPGYVQWFGEVAAASSAPCTQMGSGVSGATAGAATMSCLFLINAAGDHVPANATTATITAPTMYNIGQTTPTSFAFGGPGAASGCCTPKSCSGVGVQCGTVSDSCSTALVCGVCPNSGTCSAGFQCPAVTPDPPPVCAGPVVGDTTIVVDGPDLIDGPNLIDAPIDSPPNVGDSGGDDDSGCCGAGHGVSSLGPSVLVLLVLRRRRSRAHLHQAIK